VAEHDRAEHHLFGELAGFRLDHQHAVTGPGNDEVEIGRGHFVGRRIEPVFAIYIGDTTSGDRSKKWHAGKSQGRRRADHCRHVGIVLEVVAQHRTDDLGLVAVPLDEQRSNGTVDQPRGQHLLLRRASLALEEAAWDLAGGETFLLIVHGERKEIEPGLRGLFTNDGAENLRFAVSDHHGAVRLASDLSAF
jgi:hypothetical protein